MNKAAWRVAGILSLCGLLGLAGSAPFMLPLLRAAVERIPGPLPLPLPLIFVLGLVQQAVLVTVLTGVGLMLAKKIGLGAPLIETWLARGRVETSVGSVLGFPLLVGAGVGLILSLLLYFWFLPRLPQLPIAFAARLALWQRIGACFGGIVEELMMRLFLMSLLALLLGKVWRRPDGMPGETAMWTAIGVSAVVFGLGHLPSASLFLPVTPLVVTAALLLNGIAGVAFGRLYWKRGIESAMLAHFSCGVLVWVITPVFIQT